MKITIYAKKDNSRKFIKEGAALYLKRLAIYCRIKLIWFPDTPADIVLNGAYTIQVKTKGMTMSTMDFSKKLDNLKLRGISNIVFVIGDTPLANEVISLTNSDTDQSLLAVLLLEQLYRVHRIQNNETYHK